MAAASLAALRSAIGSTLLQPFHEVCSEAKELVSQVLSQIEGLNRAEAELTTECREACKSVSRAVTKAYSYINEVDEFVRCAQEKREINKVKAQVKKKNFKPLFLLLRQLKRHLTKATSLCAAFQTACEEAEASCDRASTECADNHSKALLRKRAMQVGGGTTAAGLIVGGAATGVILIAGVFTYGVGTIVGLSLTAAGTATVGTGTAVGTAMVANRYDDLARQFGELGSNFNSISSIASRLCDAVEKVEFQLQRAAEELDDINYCRKHKMLKYYICRALDKLWRKCDELYKITSVDRENLEEQKKILQEKVAAL